MPTLSKSAIAAVVILLAVLAPAGAADAACWRPPVGGTVVDPFRPPPCPFCAGNRGLEYRTLPGATVRAVAAGEVTFSGSVAGTRYVVVRLRNGWLVTYGRLSDNAVRRGERVVTGTTIGHTGRELFFGLRIEGRYADPAPHLGRLVGRARLVPTDGSPAPPPPPPRLRCGRVRR